MTIVCIEGIDSSGKRTICNRLVALANDSKAYTSTDLFDFPHYQSLTGPFIKQLLTDNVKLYRSGSDTDVDLRKMKAVLLQALMSMNRYEEIDQLLCGSLLPNQLLVLDRYFASGIAYGLEDGLPEVDLINIHKALPQPDLSILIDLSAEESMKRRPVRRDAYEADAGFLNRVRARYQKLFADPPDVLGGTWVAVDGMGTEDEVFERVAKVYKDEGLEQMAVTYTQGPIYHA